MNSQIPFLLSCSSTLLLTGCLSDISQPLKFHSWFYLKVCMKVLITTAICFLSRGKLLIRQRITQ